MTATPFSGGPVSIRQAILHGSELLAGIADNPRLEARLLLAHALGLTVADVIANPDRVVDPTPFLAMLNRRMTHEPVAYLLGRREFWSLDLLVSPATLIPRPDSETIVEAALDLAPNPAIVLDLGTGSGCLLLAILHERPLAFGIGVDRSFDALAVARRNAVRCDVSARACFVRGDWATAMIGRFDLIVCNPPYIPRQDIPALMQDVARYEPHAALDGGPDGLDAYRRLVPDLPRLLTRDGHAVLEVGAGQAEAVAELGRDHGMRAEIRPDLVGIARAVVLSASSV